METRLTFLCWKPRFALTRAALTFLQVRARIQALHLRRRFSTREPVKPSGRNRDPESDDMSCPCIG